MGRLEPLRPDELNSAQRALYEAITGGPRAGGPSAVSPVDGEGRLVGPFNAMLLAPNLGDALQRLGGLIRYRGTLSDRCRELAILTVAAEQRCGFEQRAHEVLGARAGLTEAELAVLRAGAPLELADPEEAAVLTATRALARHGDLSDPDYTEAVATLGEATLFELTTLVGYYSLLALQMRVFGVR